MKNTINKIKAWALRGVITTTIIGFVALINPVHAQFNSPSPTPAYTVSTNFGALSATVSYFTLLTNAAKISQVQIIGGAGVTVMDMYDNSVTNFSYTNGAYATLTNYTSNVVYQTISPLTGVTNNFTNLQLVTVTITNAANTNVIPYRTYIAAPNTLATYTVNDINSKGISVRVNASTNATILVTYRPND